ncbi:unnamed protein product, partial [Polarella glacialis]
AGQDGWAANRDEASRNLLQEACSGADRERQLRLEVQALRSRLLAAKQRSKGEQGLAASKLERQRAAWSLEQQMLQREFSAASGRVEQAEFSAFHLQAEREDAARRKLMLEKEIDRLEAARGRAALAREKARVSPEELAAAKSEKEVRSAECARLNKEFLDLEVRLQETLSVFSAGQMVEAVMRRAVTSSSSALSFQSARTVAESPEPQEARRAAALAQVRAAACQRRAAKLSSSAEKSGREEVLVAGASDLVDSQPEF